MEEKIKQLVSYVQSSLYFCNEAFNEIWCITQTPNSEEEYKLISGHPFKFYGISLQYCFAMEYNKLLDPNSSKENENVASLIRLNNSVNEFIGDQYKLKYFENKKILSEIRKSEIYIWLKDLRNKKFGHADSHSINNPLKIAGFSGKQIEEIASQLKILLNIANNSFDVLGYGHFIIHHDDRTANFIRYHAIYKQYYYKNFIKAANEGYRLNIERPNRITEG
jgi:hypothetical protein